MAGKHNRQVVWCLAIASGLLIALGSRAVHADPASDRARLDADHLAQITMELAEGTDVNGQIEGMLGEWPVHGTRLHMAAARGYKSSVEFLVTKGADVNSGQFDVKGPADARTPLALAARNGHLDVVMLLVEKGAQVEPAEPVGQSALWCAAAGGHKSVAEFLLAKGAKVNPPGEQGETALHAAAENGHILLSELLLSKGADINADAGEYAGTPLQKALARKHCALATMLVLKGAAVTPGKKKANPLADAAAIADRGLVELMIDRGARADGASLLAAVEAGSVEVAAVLLSRGAEVNFQGHYKQSPLHAAVSKGKADEGSRRALVTMLLDAGANPKLKDEGGNTPLHVARDASIGARLIKAGADVNAVGTFMRTPLHNAAQAGRLDMVGLLLARGADRAIRDDRGKTALDLASDKAVIDALSGS